MLLLNVDPLAGLFELEVLDPCRHLLLILLELAEVVEVEDHDCDEKEEVADVVQVWVLSLVVFEHD